MREPGKHAAAAERTGFGTLAAHPPPGAGALLREGGVATALLAAYLLLEWISSIGEHRGVPVTAWNPGLGVAFAVMVLRGPAFGLVLCAGVILSQLLVVRTELSWPVVLAIAGLLSSAYAVGAALARGRLRLDLEIGRVRDVLVLLVVGCASALAATVLLSGLLVAAGELRLAELSASALPLFVGDLIGIAVVTPLVLRLAARRTGLTLASLSPLVPEAALYLVLGGFALAMTATGDSAASFAFVSLLFLPVVAAAIRHGIDGASLALAAAQLGLLAVLDRDGHDAVSFTAFQVVMFVLTTTGLLVGVVVSERREASRAARKAALELQSMQAVAARATRLNMVSGMASALAHEVSQPMTATRALARSVQELLRAPAPDIERARANLSELVEQVDHASAVVRRIRDFLRRGPPSASTLQVRGLLRDAVALAQPEVRSRGVRLEFAVPHACPPVHGDRVQLQQVVLNLVRNAAESITEAGMQNGVIRVSARPEQSGRAVEFAVVDNGPGVPKDLAVFEPLVSSRPEGTGLGLPICASIVTAHGGRIWLHGAEPGATEFRFTLPAAWRSAR